MHSISSKALALFKEHAKQTAKISVTPKSGNSFVLTEADILTNGFKLNRSSVSGGTVELGSVIASELDLTLENYNERFQGTAFEGAKLFVSACVTDGLTEYPVDFGYFTVDEVLKGKNAITITALDRMVKFDKEIEADFFTDNPNDTFDIIDENLNKIYADSETKLVWKFYSSDKTVSELVKRICYYCGIRLKTDLSTLPNHDYTVVSIPQTDGLTYRHLLSWCCQIMGVCAYMDSDGTLVLKWYSESGVELDVGDRYDSVIGENSIVLNRLTITVADKTYTSGTGSYAIDLTGNMLVQTNPQEMLDNLCSAIGGLTYIPFTAETVPFPQLEPLDKINIIDKNGNIYPTIITNWTFSLNNSTILAGQGISETKNNYAAAAPFTPAQSFIIEKKSNEIKDEFDSKIEQTRTSILLEVSGKYATGEEVSSALKVTNEAITSEVSRAQSAESGLSSSISQNAEAITSEVTRAKNAESSMSTLIKQNADNILLRVTKKDLSDEVASEVASEIEQSADTIRLKASKIVWQSDKSSMTEDGVLTAQGANITGNITATSLVLDGCKISTSDIDGLPTTPDMSLYIKVGDDGKIGTGTFANDGNSGKAFKVSSDGLLQAKNAVIYGTVYASGGEVGGFSIKNKYLKCGTVGSNNGFLLYPGGSSTTYSVAGSSYKSFSMIVGSDFGVTPSGKLHASGAEISGNITAKSLTLDGCSIKASAVKGENNKTLQDELYGNSTGTKLLFYKAGTAIKQTESDTAPTDQSHSNDYFSVSTQGLLTAANAVIYGTIYASSGKFTGEITATGGTIGGFMVDESKLSYGTVGNDYAFLIYPYGEKDADGNWVYRNPTTFAIESNTNNPRANFSLIIGKSFGVSDNGKLYASGAEITGEIAATSGKIGKWEIGVGQVYSSSATKLFSNNISKNDSGEIIRGTEIGFNPVSINDFIYSSEYNTTTKKWENKFQVSRDGTMTCKEIFTNSTTVSLTSKPSSGGMMSNGRYPFAVQYGSNVNNFGFAVDTGGNVYAEKFYTNNNSTDLQTQINGKASTSHTHSNYALTSHTHGNTELWSGNHFLTSTASSTAQISLSGNISDQNIGVVLVFSPCTLDDSGDFGNSTDYFYQTFFIPKAFIPSGSYKTMSFALHYEKYNLNGNKILKIYNNKIEGYITNSDAGTSNGVTYNNKRFILRKVYGV